MIAPFLQENHFVCCITHANEEGDEAREDVDKEIPIYYLVSLEILWLSFTFNLEDE